MYNLENISDFKVFFNKMACIVKLGGNLEMKKYLLIISLVLISLLAVGSASAADAYNLTDDSSMQSAGTDADELQISEMDDVKRDDTQTDLDNDAANVFVDNVTIVEGDEANIPFNVTDENGTPLNGEVVVTVNGEDGISSYVELTNGTGQKAHKIDGLIDTIKNTNGMKLSDLFGIFLNSMNTTKINMSAVASGVTGIYGGLNLDIWNSAFLANRLANATAIGGSDLVSDLSRIVSLVSLKDSATLNNILDAVSISKQKFLGGIAQIFNVTSDEVLETIIDFVDRLDLKVSDKTKILVLSILLNDSVNLKDVKDIVSDVLENNDLSLARVLPALGDVTSGFKFNLSGILHSIFDSRGSAAESGISKIEDSFKIDGSRILDSLMNGLEFNTPQIISEISNITGIESSRISNVIDGLEDIINGIEFNRANLLDGFDKIFDGFTLNTTVICRELASDIRGISIDREGLIEGLQLVLNESGVSEWEIMEKIGDVIDNLGIDVTPELKQTIAEIVDGKTISVSDIAQFIGDAIDNNNLTVSDVIAAVADVTNGFSFDLSEIFNKMADLKYNSSDISNGIDKILKSITIDNSNILKAITSIPASTKYNLTNAVEGFGLMFKDAKYNSSRIISGINKIISEFDYSISDLKSISKTIVNYANFNSSMVKEGFSKIVNGFALNVSDVISQIVGRFGYATGIPHNFTPGVYDIVVRYYSPDGRKSIINDTAKLIVLPKENVKIDVSVVPGEKYGDRTKITFMLKDGYGKPISGVATICIDGERIGNATTDKNGIGSYAVRDLSNGIHSLAVYYGGANKTVEFYLDVGLVQSKIISWNLKTKTVDTKVDGKSGDNLLFVLEDENDNLLSNQTLLIVYNGNVYKRVTDDHGIYRINVNLKKAGTYKVFATFLGDDVYSASYAVSKITVKKQTPKLVAKKKTYKANAKKKVLKATFKSAKGNPIKAKTIKFTVKGKTYSAKTNKKGVATVKVKLAKKGTYKVSVKFAGDSTYNKVTKKTTLKIK